MTVANIKNTKKNSTKVRLFVLFLLLILTTTGAFAQGNTVAKTTSTEVSISKDSILVISTENSVAAGMDFAVWFMGSKKTTNAASNGTFSKKQLINSGINTNSVLIRSFLKKINTQENGVA